MKSVVLSAAIAAVIAATVNADCTAEIDSAGGWFRTSDSTWFKGAEFRTCVGNCVSMASSLPFTAIVDGQPIVQPTDQPWYDADDEYWCATVSDYTTSGSNKKRWGYCACPKACSTFTTKGTCSTSLATDPAVTCFWYGGNCYDTPDCSSANDIFSGSKLKNWCGKESTCVYNGTCVDKPGTCDGVDPLFDRPSNNYKKACEAVSGCLYSSGDCSSVPGTCSGIDALDVPGKTKSSLCEDADCLYQGGSCFDSPGSCSEVDALDLEKEDKQDLCKDTDGCFFSSLGCLDVPNNCSALEALSLATKVKRKMCRDISGCSYVEGQCVTSPADCAAVDALDLNNANTKLLCDDTDGCFYATGSKTCVDTPSTCSTVDAVDIPNGAKKRMCNRISGCLYSRGSCLEIPAGNCSGISALDVTGRTKGNLCNEDSSCYYHDGTCKDVPASCADVHTELAAEDPSGRLYRSVCDGLSGCGVYNGMCRTTPTSCANVETYYSAVSNREKRNVCRGIDSEPCDISSGVCSSVTCPTYKGQKTNCRAIAACSYVRGNCCATSNACLGYTQEQCDANSDVCVYKGRGPNRDCTCINP